MANKATTSSAHTSVLTWDQVSRLNEVLSEAVPVHGRAVVDGVAAVIHILPIFATLPVWFLLWNQQFNVWIFQVLIQNRLGRRVGVPVGRGGANSRHVPLSVCGNK